MENTTLTGKTITRYMIYVCLIWTVMLSISLIGDVLQEIHHEEQLQKFIQAQSSDQTVIVTGTQRTSIKTLLVVSHLMFWALGLVLLLWGERRIQHHLRMRTQAEAALLASEDRYSSFFHDDLSGDYISDPSGQLIDCNPSFIKIFGFSSKEEALRCDLSAIYPDPGERDDFLRQIHTQHRLEGYETELCRLDGSRVHVVENAIGEFNDAGELVQIKGYIIDHTKRKLAEQQLRENEQSLRHIIENMPVMMCAFDEQWHIIAWNRECERVTGYTNDEMIGHEDGLTRLYPNPKYRAKLIRKWTEEVGNFRNRLSKVTTKEGQIRHIAWSSIAQAFPIQGWATWGIAVDITEQIEAEEALREAHEHLKATLNALPDLLFELDSNGIILDYRVPDMSLLYLPPEKFVGKTIRDIMPPETSMIIENGIREARVKGRHQGSTYSLKIRNKVHWFELAIAVKNVEFSTDPHFIVMVRHITERKQAEDEVKRSRQRLIQHLRATPLAYVEKNLDFQVTDWNTAAEKIFGYPKTEALGKKAAQLVVPERLRDQITGLWQRIIEEGTSIQHTNENRTKDGQMIYCEWHNTPLRNEFGEVIGIASLGQDVTQRRKAEEELAAEKERLAVTLRSIADGVITTDTSGRVMLLNQVAERMTGWKQYEAVGRMLNEVFYIVNETTRQPIPSPLDDVLSTGEAVGLTNNAVLLSRDGCEYAIAESGSPIRDKEGGVLGVVLVFRDVTEARKLERAKTNFINSVSHELRTPLTPILGYAEMLLTVELPAEQKTKFLKQIITSVHRERRLVDELLTIARLESGTERYHFEEVNVHALLETMASSNEMLVKLLVEERYDTRQYTYETSVANDLKTAIVNVDMNRIQQVVENLLVNAVKFSPPDRLQIHFKAELDGAEVRVSVSDAGIGIPPDEQRAIFEPFHQIRQSSNSISDGIGQGLAISRRYIEAHHGRIELESEVDTGSRFVVVLPVHRFDEED